MAVTKRTRYEVLRRDGFRCRYCGATPAEAELRIDHVVPVALGGSDAPGNLVAACHDCNAGKAASAPDAAGVAQVSDDDLRWRDALLRAADEATERIDEANAYAEEFREAWESWAFGFRREALALPDGWLATVHGWRTGGLPIAILTNSVDIAMSSRAARDAKFAYLCGVVRNRLAELQTEAKKIYDVATKKGTGCGVDHVAAGDDPGCVESLGLDCRSFSAGHAEGRKLGWFGHAFEWSHQLAGVVDGKCLGRKCGHDWCPYWLSDCPMDKAVA
jgi:hypothetical protein